MEREGARAARRIRAKRRKSTGTCAQAYGDALHFGRDPLLVDALVCTGGRMTWTA